MSDKNEVMTLFCSSGIFHAFLIIWKPKWSAQGPYERTLAPRPSQNHHYATNEFKIGFDCGSEKFRATVNFVKINYINFKYKKYRYIIANCNYDFFLSTSSSILRGLTYFNHEHDYATFFCHNYAITTPVRLCSNQFI